MKVFQQVAVAIVAGLAVALAGSTAEALTQCKVKFSNTDGTILVAAKEVSGTLLWGYTSGQETSAFANAGTCVVAGKAKDCTLGDTASGIVRRLTPPPLCRLYLKDGVGTCSPYIKKCTPGARGHDFGAQTFVGESAGNVTMTGTFNTGLGKLTLAGNTSGSFNTAVGFEALQSNGTGAANTALGDFALLFNTSGGNNTAVGFGALQANTTANNNVAVGHVALADNTTGIDNTALGTAALTSNTTGNDNIGIGKFALASNLTGAQNIGVGKNALTVSTGSLNTAVGYGALDSTTGNSNTAIGHNALSSLGLGNRNIALGADAGSAITGGVFVTDNIMIGNVGLAADLGVTRIGSTQVATFISGIRGATTGVGDAVSVLIDSNGQLGTISSSRRFKTDIHDMSDSSSKVLQLRPVTFRYKPELDPSGTPQYGLIAEEVAQVMPDLVARDKSGQIETVKYHLLATLLLNEVQKQQKVIAAQAELLQTQAHALADLKTRMIAVETALPAAAPLPASCDRGAEVSARIN